MKLLGAALLLVSAGWLGGSWKRAQTRRLAVLDALDRTLSRLGPELERGMPLPVFFTGEGAREPLLTGPFSRAAAALERGLGAEQALLTELAPLRELWPSSPSWAAMTAGPSGAPVSGLGSAWPGSGNRSTGSGPVRAVSGRR